MAKGSAMGLWRGKKGSSVFYKIANSNSAQKQGIRERNYEPANPQTANQAGQRMKLLPAQRVYGVLKDIIERSWQGVKYGEAARREFLKLALSQADGWPAVEKNSPTIIPGAYQISKGTLTEIRTYAMENDDQTIQHHTTMKMDSRRIDTIGDMSKALLDGNSFLAEGMQLTFVVCFAISSNNASPVWKYCSFILDTTSEEDFNDFLLENGVPLRASYTELCIGTPDDTYLYASAVILSQDATTPLRSNATLFVNTSLLPAYFGGAARIAARATYMKKSSTAVRDWPVEEQEIIDQSTYEGQVTLEGITTLGSFDYSSFNGRNALVARRNTGDTIAAVYVKTGGAYQGDSLDRQDMACLVDTNGNLISGQISITGEMVPTCLPVAAVPSLANVKKISLDA